MEALRRILYIEDNPTNFRLVEKLLRHDGFEVLHAHDGFDGIKRAVEERDTLDLILMDINLPGMDGYEAATKIKNLKGFEAIPIVALTVNAMRGDRKRSLAAGCDGYIPKPIDTHTFNAKVQEYLKGKRERIQASEETFYLREHNRKLVNRLESTFGQLRVTHDKISHKDKLASLGEMAAGVAHELNNPLSSISFSVQALLRDVPEGHPQRVHMDRIFRNVERMQRLAEGLTSFARPSETSKALVDLPKVLAETVVLSEHELRKRGIRLVKEIPWDLPQVRASESQLHHVFLNLVKNAAQAVSQKHEGAERPEGAPAGTICLRTTCTADGCVCVEVADDGVGISAEYQDRLFTPFFTTKPRGQGTGLGLYIVKQIIEDLGGKIEVRSELGSGTTFGITLPTVTGREALLA
ncbi:MAG: response regulator [Deltaproteobacteria bacterium]|nr:response regulator [Deltaproteobacteria bacterium]